MKKTAQEIMSKELITVGMDVTVLEAYRTMQKHRIRHLPVLDESKQIVGLLSDRDVQRCLRVERKNNSAVLDVELSLDPKIRVGEAMSWPVHRVQGDISVRDVALRMLNEKISSMIVSDREAGRTGILTTDDMLRLLINLLEKDPSRLRLAVDSIVDDFYPAWTS
jgi:CBS-domain-containing membrane protein